MVDFGKTPAAIGGVLVGVGGGMLANTIDTTMGAAAKPWTEKPSTWVNLVGGAAVALASVKMVPDENVKTIGVVAGATMFVKGLSTVYQGMTQKGLSYAPAVFAPSAPAPASLGYRGGDNLVEVR